MSSKSLVQAVCLSKCHSTISQQPVANIYSPQLDTAAPLSSNPCRIPSPGCKVNAGNLTGTCPVCKRNGICIVSTTGLLHQHGPRGNKCKGGRSRPFPASLKPVVPRLTNGNCSQTAATVHSQPSTSSATAVGYNFKYCCYNIDCYLITRWHYKPSGWELQHLVTNSEGCPTSNRQPAHEADL